MTKISRGGGYFRKIFGQGGYTKNTPPTPYSRCLHNTFVPILHRKSAIGCGDQLTDSQVNEFFIGGQEAKPGEFSWPRGSTWRKQLWWYFNP